MTMLYSIYYEFSKRYPHGKSTAIKQDSASAKTELIFRMLNYTLGEKTFKHGLQRFMNDRLIYFLIFFKTCYRLNLILSKDNSKHFSMMTYGLV